MQNEVAELVRKMRAEAEARTSVEIVVAMTTRQHSPPPGASPKSDSTSTYIETNRGQRLLRDARLKDGVEDFVTESFADGRRTAEARYERKGESLRQTSINVNRSFGFEEKSGYIEKPVPLSYEHMGLTPLRKALPDAEPSGRSRVIDRDCEVFVFRNVAGTVPQDWTYHIDREHAIALRVEARPAGQAAAPPNWSWEAKKIERYDGHPLVSTSRYVSYDRSKDGGGSVRTEIDYAIQSARFNIGYPSAFFWYKAEPGVHIVDSVAGTSFNAPGTAAPVIKTGEIIAVEPPDPDRLARMTTWVALGVIGAILVALAVRKIRSLSRA